MLSRCCCCWSCCICRSCCWKTSCWAASCCCCCCYRERMWKRGVRRGDGRRRERRGEKITGKLTTERGARYGSVRHMCVCVKLGGPLTRPWPQWTLLDLLLCLHANSVFPCFGLHCNPAACSFSLCVFKSLTTHKLTQSCPDTLALKPASHTDADCVWY